MPVARVEAPRLPRLRKDGSPGKSSLQCCSSEPAVLQQRTCSAAATSLQYCSSKQSSCSQATDRAAKSQQYFSSSSSSQPASSANQSLCATSEPVHPRFDAQITIAPVGQPRLDARPVHSRLDARMAVAFVKQLTLNA